jgi:iron complex transport system ATP-binding protein
MRMAELVVDRVSCSYGTIGALEGVSFGVRPGELLGVLGPNGSGKTTLLKAVCGVLRPSAGRVLLDGEEVSSMRPIEIARKVAVVPQHDYTSLNLTALEAVLTGRSPYMPPFGPESEADARMAQEAMETTRCLHLAGRRIDELSGGERRRVILAKALAQEPKVLLLDEPTVNLDVSNQIELMEAVRALCGARGVISLSVFHDLNLAARYSDQILLLKEGRLFASGSPEEVMTVQNLRSAFGVDVEISRHDVVRLVVTVLSSLPTGDDGKERAGTRQEPTSPTRARR